MKHCKNTAYFQYKPIFCHVHEGKEASIYMTEDIITEFIKQITLKIVQIIYWIVE